MIHGEGCLLFGNLSAEQPSGDLSSRQFTRVFQEQLGLTPKKFIIETRLRHARWLVENGNLSMTEIAYQTGFSDCAHFATTFKAKFGASPSSFRQKPIVNQKSAEAEV